MGGSYGSVLKYKLAVAFARARSDRLVLANAVRGFALLRESVGARGESRRLWQEAHDLYVKVDVPAGVRECLAKLRS